VDRDARQQRSESIFRRRREILRDPAPTRSVATLFQKQRNRSHQYGWLARRGPVEESTPQGRVTACATLPFAAGAPTCFCNSSHVTATGRRGSQGAPTADRVRREADAVGRTEREPVRRHPTPKSRQSRRTRSVESGTYSHAPDCESCG